VLKFLSSTNSSSLKSPKPLVLLGVDTQTHKELIKGGEFPMWGMTLSVLVYVHKSLQVHWNLLRRFKHVQAINSLYIFR